MSDIERVECINWERDAYKVGRNVGFVGELSYLLGDELQG